MHAHHPEWAEALTRAGVPVAAAMLGGLAGAVGVGRSRTVIAPLVHFAAGAFLAIALLYLLPEAAEMAGWPAALLTMTLGLGLCAALGTWAGASCPACDVPDGPTLDGRLGVSLMLVVGLHSILDGLALAQTGHGHGHHSGEILPLAMLFHKVPEGLAVAAVCRAGGKTLAAALGLTALVEAPTFLGVLAGAAIGSVSEFFLGAALGAVAGSFLYLVGLTVSGSGKNARPAFNNCVTVSGIVIVLAARLALG
jgi:zinc transporter, ZIP family